MTLDEAEMGAESVSNVTYCNPSNRLSLRGSLSGLESSVRSPSLLLCWTELLWGEVGLVGPARQSRGTDIGLWSGIGDPLACRDSLLPGLCLLGLCSTPDCLFSSLLSTLCVDREPGELSVQ